MTSEDLTPSSPPPEPPQGKGRGCVLGGLAVIGSGVVGWVLSGIVVAIIPDTAEQRFFVFASLFPIAVLIAAAIYWRKVPGFLLGIALTIAIQLTIFTGCAALVIWAWSNQ